MPLLLLMGAMALAVGVYVLLNARLPGRAFTLAQQGRVRALGHRGVVAAGSNCTDCHR